MVCNHHWTYRVRKNILLTTAENRINPGFPIFKDTRGFCIICKRYFGAGEAERGVIAPECLEAKRFLKRMADAGAPVQFEEICSKEVSVC